MGEARDKALRARETARFLAAAGSGERNHALRSMAESLRLGMRDILAANAGDVAAARDAGTPDPLIDRLSLDEGRVESMAAGLEEIAAQPDPLGRVLTGGRLANGLAIEKVTVPLGVVERSGLPADAVCLLEDGGHEAVDELMGLRGIVDVLIPRGGAGLIRRCVEGARVPVVETGVGNCHTFVERSADVETAIDIVVNAKCSRPSVCNACESLLVDEGLLERVPDALERILAALDERGVTVHGDAASLEAARRVGARAVEATEEDWASEYLSLDISCRVVSGIEEALDHIARYGTGHSECIVTSDYGAAEEFLSRVDAASVYVNASTRFTDGSMFGLGAEIGISTQKLHERGPMGADALVTTKYLCRGSGQTRW